MSHKLRRVKSMEQQEVIGATSASQTWKNKLQVIQNSKVPPQKKAKKNKGKEPGGQSRDPKGGNQTRQRKRKVIVQLVSYYPAFQT
eukprot:5032072-Amphidinium_carterae.1